MKLSNNSSIGYKYEDAALCFLESKALKLITRNYYSKYGEIDLVMLHRDTLVFVEVRARKNTKYGHPIETIDKKKQNKLTKTAFYYLSTNKDYQKLPYRFDAVTLVTNQDNRLMWHQNIITVDY